MGILVVLTGAIYPQVQNTAAPTFEVSDIQVCKPNAATQSGDLFPGGRLDLQNTTLRDLIRFAYDVPEDFVVDGPPWVVASCFNLVAKVNRGTPLDTIRLMMQQLLAERFQLAVHREVRTMPIYALLRGKTEPKLVPDNGLGSPGCGSVRSIDGLSHFICHNVSMKDFALRLPDMAKGYLNQRPVIDLTGIDGIFEIDLAWLPPKHSQTADGVGPTVFDAINQQLKLMLTESKHPMSVVVIDKVHSLIDEN